MPRYMLDTDTCSYIMKRSSAQVLRRLQAVPVTDVCMSLDDNATVKAIIADGQVLHADVEVVALAREIEQSGVPFRRIDPKLVTYDAIASVCRRRADTFHDIDDVDYIGIGHVWRERPKVRSSVKQSTRVAHCLGACAPPRNLPSTTNHQQRSVFQTVGVSSMFNVG